MFLYSGHETTLGYMMEALQVLKPHIPPYGSALMFEVHRKNDQHFIKVNVIEWISQSTAIEFNEIIGSWWLNTIEINFNNAFFQLRYRHDTSTSHVKDLVIPGCDKLCPVEKFILLQEDVIPSVPLKEACMADFVPHELQKLDEASANQ